MATLDRAGARKHLLAYADVGTEAERAADVEYVLDRIWSRLVKAAESYDAWEPTWDPRPSPEEFEAAVRRALRITYDADQAWNSMCTCRTCRNGHLGT